MNRRQFLSSGLILGTGARAGVPAQAQSSDDENPSLAMRYIHDPAIIRHADTYYLFSTGPGILVRQSPDLREWRSSRGGPVFERIPDWALEYVPRADSIWAPDISFYNDKYHLYYSVSTFGSNHSCIGLATNVTLDPADDHFEWVDQGMVVATTSRRDHNAIDPNLIVDAEGTAWLAYGSHWSGVKMLRLDDTTGKPASEDEPVIALASRRLHPRAVEAPFIIRKGDFYYLFVSFDACCRGVNSTYRVMVGRSESITGPYVDRDAVPMLEDGGTQVTFPTERWRGPGHNAILQEGDTDYIVYHAYDAESGGTSALRINPLAWDDDGWPVMA
jgi:arabinan endo-1,5-alpha-L-arabinosidase